MAEEPRMSLPRFVPTALAFALGCWLAPAEVRAAPGVVYLVGGIGGISPLSPAARLALPLAGVEHELRDFPWQHGKGMYLRDLQDRAHILAKAAELAKQIRELHEREPDRRVYLIGHSAGTAIIVHAAEMLPPGSVERMILLSSALSPTYDLTGALRGTRGEIVSFYSQCDRLPLDLGTRQFGTADRVYGPAAGLAGFVMPANLDDDAKRCYERLVQVPWTLDRMFAFEGGWHHSTAMPLFLGRRVAPWLKED
jgi:pimeloyl-ACP methyl ester carboxylesterase